MSASLLDRKNQTLAESGSIVAIDQAYENALAVYGIDPDKTAVAEAAALLRGRSVGMRVAVLAGLDEWRQLHDVTPERKDWLLGVVQAADDDAWRVRLRDVIKRGDKSGLSKLAESKKLEAQAPYTLLLLVDSLYGESMQQTALRVLKRAQQRYPADFELNQRLVIQLNRSPHFAEALRYATAAAAIRPEDRNVARSLGVLYERLGRLEEAARAYRRYAQLSGRARELMRLGAVLEKLEKWDDATAVYRQAFDLYPFKGDVALRYGIALNKTGRAREAEPILRTAVANAEGSLAGSLQRHESKTYRTAALNAVATAYAELAGCLRTLGRDDAAGQVEILAAQAAAVGKAIVAEKPRHDLALAAIRRALKVKPDDGISYYRLGNTLSYVKPTEAIAAYRKALELKMPRKRGQCYLALASMLTKQGKPAAAEAVYRESLRRVFAKNSRSVRFYKEVVRARTMNELAKLLAYGYERGRRRPDAALAAQGRRIATAEFLLLVQSRRIPQCRWSLEGGRKGCAASDRPEPAHGRLDPHPGRVETGQPGQSPPLLSARRPADVLPAAR